MNFDSFNKKEAAANPFLQGGVSKAPTSGAQAVQGGVSKAPMSGATSGAPTPQQSLFPIQQPQSQFPSQQPQPLLLNPLFPFPLFPSQQPLFPTQTLPSQQPQPLFPTQTLPSRQPQFLTQTLLPSQQPQSLFPTFPTQTFPLQPQSSSQSSGQQTPVKLTKYTPKITTEKVLALLSSEWYVNDEDITVIPQLNPVCDAKDVTKVAPLAAAAFVDESVMVPLTQLAKIHVKFLQELVQETVETEKDVWNLAIYLTTSHEMYNMVQFINAVRPYRILIIQRHLITPEAAFVLAVHAFATNNKPHDVMTASEKCSKDVAKLAADMCMASYGLRWILETQTQDYISKHGDTYILAY